MMPSTFPAQSRLRVVIIDDDVTFGTKALRLLETNGFQVRFHCGPFGSLLAVHESNCDVILLDICMPKLDGHVISRLIKDTFGKTKRIILCSNMESSVLRRLAERVGVDGSLAKSLFEEASVPEIVATLGARQSSGSWPAMHK